MKKSDRIQRLIDELREVKFYDIANSLEDLSDSKDFDSLDRMTFLERLIDPAYDAKSNRLYVNRLKDGKLSGCPQTIDSCRDSAERVYLPGGIVETLSSLDFIRQGLNICILGPSDAGKSYLAKSLGVHACQKYRAMYQHCEPYLEKMVALKETNYAKYQKDLVYAFNLDLLILDDFLLHTISDEREIKVLHEIMEQRTEHSRSTIVCSQREPTSWKSMILNDEVQANAIMKRAIKHYTIVIQPKC